MPRILYRCLPACELHTNPNAHTDPNGDADTHSNTDAGL
ncbi:MAG: hypothetical protein QOE33_783 [Acidobacteriota bacterium]|nr:hypothetical protein [Acidobacteriota bacterium]